ncbi:hypothetical protein, partial [Sphingomonas sp. Leaf5]|uniref:hypothetical protein n=1 Tax=Sphingomonas sp. Leaf5 TaxID=1735671 RepID=UPI001F2D78EF
QKMSRLPNPRRGIPAHLNRCTSNVNPHSRLRGNDEIPWVSLNVDWSWKAKESDYRTGFDLIRAPAFSPG